MSAKKITKSNLTVNKGIEQPDILNVKLIETIKKQAKSNYKVKDFVNGILSGDIKMLSQSITLIESTLKKHQDWAEEIIEQCLPHSGKSIRIGITGVPGVGKSTFIEAFGKHLTELGYKVAVLAVDPSSRISKGSILGDKTRMEELATDSRAYIRPSPSAGSLGGVARKTRESIILCEAAGFNVIIIETVGVGQSETTVKDMVDFFLLLMLAGAGDELQGIKRGIMEMADMIAINKADGDNYNKAILAKAQYSNALHLFPPAPSGWYPPVEVCSSISKMGIKEIWDSIKKYKEFTESNNFLIKNRLEQKKNCMHDAIMQELSNRIYLDDKIKSLISACESDLMHNKINPYKAAHKVLSVFLNNEAHFDCGIQ
ncbi:MAG: methylmalonyl Co-A mutase-associated GTPase MeaB [Bacteroidales bacterium]|nr:methylmalonyl Co-A mutase-associated GTPase MeaB [Bacteroidales bacterium]